MTILKIFNMDNEKEVISTLNKGEHTIGRGPMLKCPDKRVSRNHAIINVLEDTATIKSIHINPCYFIKAESKTLQILPKNEEIPLSTGDKFALLTDMYWYRVRFDREINECNESENNVTSSQNNRLRKCDSDPENNESYKRMRLNDEVQSTTANMANIVESNSNENQNSPYSEIPELSVTYDDICQAFDESIPQNSRISTSQNDQNNTSQNGQSNTVQNEELGPENLEETFRISSQNGQENDHVSTSQNDQIVTSQTEIKEELVSTSQHSIKLEDGNDGDDVNRSENNVKDEIKDEPNDPNAPSTSNQNPAKRDRCWYGENCYRKNPQHKTELSHPGDNDYDSDPDDSRPNCPYGAACYRRNKDHRRQYKHPTGTPSDDGSRTPSPQPRKKRTRKPKAKTNDDDEDNYDLNDSFIDDESEEDPFADDSEEEYKMSTDDED